MKRRPITPGHAIVDKNGVFHIIASPVTVGLNTMGVDPTTVTGYDVLVNDQRVRLRHGEYRMATFFEYCFNRSGFGRTEWFLFIPAMCFFVALGFYSAVTNDEFDRPWMRYAMVAFCVAVPIIWVIKTYHNFTGRQR